MMRFVWKTHYVSIDGSVSDDVITFTPIAAEMISEELRGKKYQVHPPLIVPIQFLSLYELEKCLKTVAEFLEKWKREMTASGGTEEQLWKNTEEARVVGRDLFLEHDQQLRNIHEKARSTSL
jgi:hypothetical protein